MKRWTIIFLLLSAGSFRQCLGQQRNFIKYTVQDGLVANPIRCIYQDRNGFIWIGTYEGLSRYDGYKFSSYTNINGLSHNVINSIIEVGDKLLIAENNGAVDIIQNNIFQESWQAGSAVNFISAFKDRLLLATDANGFYEYKKDAIIGIPQERTGFPLGHFLTLNDSLLLCAGVDNSMVIFRKDLSILHISKFSAGHFYHLFRDSKQRIWACTASGLKLLQVTTGKKPSILFSALPLIFNIPPLINTQVTSMAEEKDGSFWIGTLRGLVHLLPNGNYHVYNEKEGLPSAIIHTLTFDKESNLWIGTSLGLAKWGSKYNVIFYNTENSGFKNDVISIYQLDNRKFILGTTRGIQQFNFDTKQFINLEGTGREHGIPVENSIPLLIHYGDNIGTVETDRSRIIPVRKIDAVIRGVVISEQHPDGTIFMGKFDGLDIIEGSSVRKILPFRITSLCIDHDGNVWVGTWDRGLFKYSRNNSRDSNFVLQDLTYLTKERSIRGLYCDKKNNIWIGTRYAGVFCLSPGSASRFKIQHFNRASGLMSDWVNAFGETESGDMWIGTYQGIDKLVKRPAGYRVFNFSKTVNFFAEIKKIIPAGNNEWVCVANTGIAYFKDEKLHQTPAFRPSILAATLGLHADKLTIFSPGSKISLKPYQNAARFEFSALAFINERQILYSYRLKGGADSTWSKPENIHEAYYASLSPGNYVFEVKTIGWNGEDSVPASFSFFINSPFWKKWWFISIAALAVALMVYVLYRNRVRQILKLQMVRNNIATDLHDDIGASLSNISILSELSTKNLYEPEKARPFLHRISEEVQSSSQAMDDIIWSVNSRNDSLQETMARMRRYAAEMFEDSETECHLELKEASSNKKLSIEQRRDVYLIYKEALNNIRKHAHANNVWIRVALDQNHLFMQFKDDGAGFNANIKTHRNGLKNLQSRVGKWKGKIKIESIEAQGTAIEINIPLNG